LLRVTRLPSETAHERLRLAVHLWWRVRHGCTAAAPGAARRVSGHTRLHVRRRRRDCIGN
jgi:hypothetical protein